MGLKLEHVLACTDFKAASDPAIERAIALAADYQADVTIFHAIELPFFGLDAASAAAERLRAGERIRNLIQGRVRELRKVHAWRGVIQSELAFGSPADEIVAAAERLEAQTIVVGLGSSSSLAHAVRASTTDRVIRTAPCPVVVVRAPAQAAPRGEAESAADRIPARILRLGVAA